MRRIVVTAVGLCFVVGLVAAVVHSRAHGDEPSSGNQKASQGALPATFQPENERPVPARGESRMRSVLKRSGPVAARPIKQADPVLAKPKSGFVSRSLQDSPSSRRTARRVDTPQFVRPGTAAREPGKPASIGIGDEPSRYGAPRTARRETKTPATQPRPSNSSRRTTPQEQPRTARSIAPKAAAPIGTPNRRIEPTRPVAAPLGNTLTSSVPQLHLAVKGPKKIRFGKPGQYRVTLSNRGNTPTDSVFVRIRLPKWVEVSGQRSTTGVIQNGNSDSNERQMIWDIQQMGGARSETLELDLSPKRDQPFKLEVDWAVRPESVATKILVLRPALDLAINGPRELEFGESAIFSITLRNPGSGDAENIVLSVVPADVQPRRIAKLAAGEQVDLEVKLTARQAGSMLVQATAIADDGLRSQKSQQVQIRRADLRVQTSAPELVFAGSVARIRVDVANKGNAIARDATATVQLPSGAQYISGIANAQVQNGRLTWPVGDLTPGNRRSYEMQCQINVPGKSQFTARLVDRKGNSAVHSAVSRVEALADLKLTVNDPKGPRAVGDPVEYEIQIVNRGTKAALGVKLVTHFSNGIEPVKVNGASGQIHPGQVVFQPIARIEAGQKISLRVTARATLPGSHNIRAELSCEDPVTKLVSQESTRFFGGSSSGSGQSPASNTPSTSNNSPAPLSPAGSLPKTGTSSKTATPTPLGPTPASAAGTPTLAR